MKQILQTYYQKYNVALWTFVLFTLIGIVVWMVRDWRYFCLFGGIGLSEFITRSIVIWRPQYRQLARRIIQGASGFMMLVVLGLVFGVNFQFEQIFFDIQAGIVTGALIQFVIARLIIPFIFGNAFCSRVCWDGALFEMMSKPKAKQVVKRRNWLAWMYLLLLVGFTVLVSWQFTNPADPTFNNENIFLRKNWIIGQNLFILTIGMLLSSVYGSRFYCRILCPFMTVSSLLYRFSWLKITPTKSAECTQCGKCNSVCPMLSDIRTDVQNKQKVSNAQCILCEQCVSACPKGVLTITYRTAE